MNLYGRPSGVVAFAALAGLSAWAGSVELSAPNLRRALADPPAHAGAVLRVNREARVTEVRPDGAVRVWEKALGPDARVTVRGITTPVQPGDNISLVGRFEPPDVVAATAHRIHRTRFVKVWVSLPVLLWLAWILAARLRPTRAGLEER